jgi:hypothetical protein
MSLFRKLRTRDRAIFLKQAPRSRDIFLLPVLHFITYYRALQLRSAEHVCFASYSSCRLLRYGDGVQSRRRLAHTNAAAYFPRMRP